ncbi:MAG: PQQ-binding-like beta-propeller repeat protein [Ferruginibacter sp.]
MRFNHLLLGSQRIAAFVVLSIISCKSATENKFTSWEIYGGTKEMTRYSSLTQIDTNNVSQLQVAWIYNSGDADTFHHSQIQCNPIIIDGTLYGVNPMMKLFATDAATGKQQWVFDPNSKTAFDSDPTSLHIMINSRGVCYWADGKDDKRIFFTAGSNTYAINATTGKAIPSFGNNGSIDLHEGLGRDVKDLFVVNSSPGMIYKNLLVLGARVDEATPAAPGHIRAYDVLTGKLQWIFHTIPQPGEYGFDTWEDSTAYKFIGGANAWSGFSLDETRGTIFVSTGSASYDFYGGKRKGSNLFANCVIALDAATGKRKWHYQLVHHDVWDKDLPSPPALITVNHDGKNIDAVAQTTKNGWLYVFDRETGKPLFDIEEVAVDTVTELSGEKLWPTQPIPKKPAAFARQTLTVNDINPYLPANVIDSLKKELQGYHYGKVYIPPGKQTSIVLPGYSGGAEWGGPAFDPQTNILYVNTNENACLMQMLDNNNGGASKETNLLAGQRLYKQHCMSCHGEERKGTGAYPSLINIQTKYSSADFNTLLNSGRRMMPAFKQLAEEEKSAIASFILSLQKEQSQNFIASKKSIDSNNILPYRLKGYTRFLSPDGYPAITPPWGTMNAINLNTGELLWQIPLGEYQELKAKGIPATGIENYGGPVVTAGGLLFIAATRDGKMRAINKRTGKILWEHTLPAAGFATPSVYELNGKQYLVIACGGGKWNLKSSDAYVAFSLPDKN